ncbi:hypothetical protein OG883_43615 [Streptomyces sp. NBC_01142]|uniref:hypothetical protein n=1 Tax=Streptomyces sp. NBC_01142 TaxID=2975865 RepID=UPI0022501348|nr:hypothetical protein [Streptomyces sp. NBC_01142]MCX4826529.1 hypothetical protein [Streptomyces sp. NBC_01142]
MRALLKEISIPFQGARQTPRLLLLPLLTGSRLIASFLLRRVARVVKLGWTAAMNLDAPPAKAAPEQGGEPADDGSANKSGPSTTKVSKKTAPATSDDAIERVGLGCLIILFAAVVIAGVIWLFMWLAWPYIAPFAPVGGAVLGVVWVIAAWMIAPPLQETATQNDHENSAGEQDQESDQDRFARGLARFIVAAVRDAAPEHMGVHIAELLERLQKEAQGFGGWDQPRLREWCTAVGIPVSRNVRAKGKGPTWGVRADELQEAFGTSLDEALEALARPALPAPSEGPPTTPGQAEEAGPVAPLTAPPAEAPVPAGHSTPVHPHLQAVPDPSPGAVA